MAVLNLLARRSRQRGSELFGDCSDDDLMDWGRELSEDDDPIFAELLSLAPEPVAEAGPRLALPQPGVFRN